MLFHAPEFLGFLLLVFAVYWVLPWHRARLLWLLVASCAFYMSWNPWFILLIFLVPAADALGLPAVSNILNTLVAYIPNVFVAILVLFLGTLAATFVADLVRGAVASANIGSPRIFAGIARWAIIGFSALVALEQLQISTPLINELFGGIVAAMAIAFGLAFGLGGQEAARRWLARGEGTVTTAASQISAQQSREDAKRARMEPICFAATSSRAAAFAARHRSGSSTDD